MKKRTKRTLAVSGKVLLRLALCTVLCAIIYLSMMFIAVGMFSKVVGYQIHETLDGESTVLVEEHFYEDGEKHLTSADVEDNQMLTELRPVPPKTLTVFNVLAQIMMLIVLAIFPYHILWEFGNHDDTKVRYKGQRPDPWRGVRVGAFASIPYAVLWALLWGAKFGVLSDGYMEIYRLATFPFMPFVKMVLPAATMQETTVYQILLLLPILLFLPVVCGVSYFMGHRQFSIHEYLVFAKKKGDTDAEI